MQKSGESEFVEFPHCAMARQQYVVRLHIELIIYFRKTLLENFSNFFLYHFFFRDKKSNQFNALAWFLSLMRTFKKKAKKLIVERSCNQSGL